MRYNALQFDIWFDLIWLISIDFGIVKLNRSGPKDISLELLEHTNHYLFTQTQLRFASLTFVVESGFSILFHSQWMHKFLNKRWANCRGMMSIWSKHRFNYYRPMIIYLDWNLCFRCKCWLLILNRFLF